MISQTLSCCILCILSASAFGQSATWLNTTTGNWNDAPNWSTGAVPNAPDAIVIFNNNGATANKVVTCSVSATIGSLTVSGTAAATRTVMFNMNSLNFYSSSGASELNFQGSNAAVFNGAVNLGSDLQINAYQDVFAYASTLTLSGAVNLGANNLYITNYEPLSSMTANGLISGAGGIFKAGNGILNLNNTNNSFSGGLSVTGGTVAVTVRASASAGVVIGGVSANNNNLGQGAVSVVGDGSRLSVTANASYANQFVELQNGTLTVDSGGVMLLSENNAANNFQFRMTGGALAGSGTLLLNGADFNYTAGSVSGGALQLVFNTGVNTTALAFNTNGSDVSGAFGTIRKTGTNALNFTNGGVVHTADLLIDSAFGAVNLNTTQFDITNALTLTGTGAWTNMLTLNTGTVSFGMANQMNNANLNAGANALANLRLNGFDQTFNTVTISGGARLALWLGGNSTLTIGSLSVATTPAVNPQGVNWLSIYNYSGNPATHLGDGTLTSSGTVIFNGSAADLSKIWFRGYNPGAVDLGGGVLAPSDFLTTTLTAAGNWFDFSCWSVDIANGAGSTVILGTGFDISAATTLQNQTVTIGRFVTNLNGPYSGGDIRTGVIVFDSGVSGSASTISGTGVMRIGANVQLSNNDLVIMNTGAGAHYLSNASITGVLMTGVISGSKNIEVRGSGLDIGGAFANSTGYTGNIDVYSNLVLSSYHNMPSNGQNLYNMGGSITMYQGSQIIAEHSNIPAINTQIIIAGNFTTGGIYFRYNGDVELTADRTIVFNDTTSMTTYWTVRGFAEGFNFTGVGGLTLNVPGSIVLNSGSNIFSGGFTKSGAGTITTLLHSNLVTGTLSAGNNYFGSSSIALNAGGLTVSGSDLYAATFGGTIYTANATTLTLTAAAATISEDAVWTVGTATTHYFTLNANRDLTINAPFLVGMANINANPGAGITQKISSTMSGGIVQIGTLTKSGAGTTILSSTINLNAVSVSNGTLEIAGDNFIRPRAGTTQPTLTMSGGLLQADTGLNSFSTLSVTSNSGLMLLNHSALLFTGVGTWTNTTFQLSLANDSGVWTKSDGVTDYNDTFVYFTSTANFSGANAWRLGNVAFTGYEQGAEWGQATVSGSTLYFLAPTGVALSEWVGAKDGSGGDTDRLWSSSSNWVGGVPNSAGRIAAVRDVDTLLTSNTIIVDVSATIGKLYLESAGGQIFNVSGTTGGLLTFNNNGSDAILTNQGVHNATISADLKLSSNVSIRTSTPEPLILSGNITGDGAIYNDSSYAGNYSTQGSIYLTTTNASGSSTSDFTGGFWLRGSSATATSGNGAGVSAGSRQVRIGANGSLFGSGSLFGDGSDASLNIQALNIGDGTAGRWYSIRPVEDNAAYTVDASIRFAGNLNFALGQNSSSNIQLTFQSAAPSYITSGTWTLSSYSSYVYASLTLKTDIQGPGTFRFDTGFGDVVVNFDGNNTFTGGIIAANNGVQLGIGSDTALGTGTINFQSASNVKMNARNGARTITNDWLIDTANAITWNGYNFALTTGSVTLLRTANMAPASGITVAVKADELFTGAGGLLITGNGTWRFEGANTYTGNTAIGDGGSGVSPILQVGNNLALGSTGTLIFNPLSNGIYTTSWLASYGGPVTLSNPVVFTGGTGIGLNGSAGLLTLDSPVGVTLNGNKDITVTGTAAFGENLSISGAYGINKTGTGTLLLMSDSSDYTGNTSITQGTLSADAGARNIVIGKYVAGESYFGSGAINFVSGNYVRTLEAVSTGSVILAGNLALNGNSAANTASVNVTEQTGTVTGNSVVTYLNPDISSTISGNGFGYLRTPGALVKNGSGSVTISGGNVVAGGTFTVQSGSLILSGGTISTPNLVLQNAVLALGAAQTQAGLGTLTLGGGTWAVNGFALTATNALLNVTGSVTIDFAGSGTLTFSNITGDWAGGFVTATNWNGNALVGSGSSQLRFVQDAGAVFTSGQLGSIQFYSTDTSLNYILGARVIRIASGFYELVPLGVGAEWDGGGDGNIWGSTAPNASNWHPNTTPDSPGSVAKFGTLDASLNGKSIQLTKVISIGGLVLSGTADRYRFYGNNLNLQNGGTDAAYIQVQDRNTVTIDSNVALGSALSIEHFGTGTLIFNGQITGANGIVKDGPGEVWFNTNNAYTGGFTLKDGTVVANNDLAFGPTGTLTLSGGTLSGGNSNRNLANNFTLGGTTATGGANALTFSGTGSVAADSNLANSGSVTISGQLTGTGALAKSGTGELLLTGNNSNFSGGFSANEGVTGINSANAIGTGTLTLGSHSDVPSTTGTLRLDANNLNITNNVNADGGVLNSIIGSATLSGTISGSNGFTSAGGTLTVTQSNSYTGTTAINSGAVIATDAGALGQSLVSLESLTSLVLNFNNDTFANNVSGSGAVNATGTNITLSGSSTAFSGTWNITGGALVSATENLGAGSVNLTGTLAVTGGENFIFSNSLTGAGTLSFNGTGTYGFGAGAGSLFTGLVNLSGGEFDWDTNASNALTSATLSVSGGLYDVYSSSQSANGLLLSGGTGRYSGTAFVNTLTVSNSSAVIFDPERMSTPPLLQQDEGDTDTLIVYGALNGSLGNMYLVTEDGTRIYDSSTVAIDSGATGTAAYGIYSSTFADTGSTVAVHFQLEELQLQANKTLILDGDEATPNGAAELHALISGSGNLNVSASYAITLNNQETFTGTTTVSTGTLISGTTNIIQYSAELVNNSVFALNGYDQLINNLSGSGTTLLGSNTLTVTENANTAYSGFITGGGVVIKNGSGTLTLSGSSDYSGGSVINSGELSLANLNALGSGTVQNLASLRLGASGTFANDVTGTGVNTIAANGVSISGNNATFTGTWNVTGSGTMTQQQNLGASGTTALNISGNLSLLFGTQDYTLNQPLTGNGNLLMQNTGTLTLATGSAFTGTLQLQNNQFTLSGSNLYQATLNVDANNKTTVASGTQLVGDLALSGGTLAFTLGNSGTAAEGIIKTNTVSGTSTIIQVSLENFGTNTLPLLQQDEGTRVLLVDGMTGSGSLNFVDQYGTALGDNVSQNIIQSGNTVASGTYNFSGSFVSGSITLGYELIALNLNAGYTTLLNGDVLTPSGGAELHAKISGDGNLQIQATNTITLNNSNTYTGTTFITSGVVVLGSNSALGQTSLLSLASQSSLDLSGKTQQIGILSGSANSALLFSSGTLTVLNGGTSSGTLSGAGWLNVSGNNLVITNSNASLTATGSVASSATLTLNAANAFGTGTLIDSGLVSFNGATGTNQNTITGSGLVSATNAANIILAGTNTNFSGTWTIANDSNFKAITADSLGAGAVNDSGTLTLGGVSSFILNTSNLISGGGVLIKEDANNVTVSHSNSYTGGSYVNAGTLTLSNLAGAGSGTVSVTSVLDLSGTGSYANNTTGSGTATVSGSVTITGSNSIALWNVTGTGLVTSQTNLGNGIVNLNGGQLTVSAGSWNFINELYGTGTLTATLSGGTFAFAPSATSANIFNGAVNMANGFFLLNNLSGGIGGSTTSGTGIMKNATLILGTSGSTLMDSGTYFLGGLTFNGGVLKIEMRDATVPAGKLTVGDLAAPEHSAIALDNWNKVSGTMPDGTDFFYHDSGTVYQLLVTATGSVSDVGAQLDVYDFNGVLISDPTKKQILENGGVSGTATYDYGALVVQDATSGSGIALGFMLRELYANTGTNVTLSNVGTQDPTNTLTAKLTGSGGFIMSGSGTYAIGSTASDYTGTTGIVSGTVYLYSASNALGNTSLLSLESLTSLNLNNKSQKVGALNNSGLLEFNGGTLAISGSNGNSTSTGTLSGSGALIVESNTLTVSGSNPLTASATINSGAAVVVYDVAGLGSGAVNDNGLFVFNGATGTNLNMFSGSGVVSATNANVILGGANTSFSGTWSIAADSNFKAVTADSLGSGKVSDSGTLTLGGVSSFILNTSNLISGSGMLVKEDANTVTISHSNNYTGGSVITGGTLKLTNLQGTGTGNVLNNAALQLDAGGVYANNISGTGLSTVSGNGVTISGSNTLFTGTWNVTGSGTMTSQQNLGASGTTAVNVAQNGSLTLSLGATNFDFNQPLTGSGTLTVSNSGTFNFVGNTGTSFEGNAVLKNSQFALSGSNTLTLTHATLTVSDANNTVVGTGTQNIANLVMSSGTMTFTLDASGTKAAGIVNTNTLTFTGSTYIVVDTGSFNNALPLLQQDENKSIQLVASTALVGTAGAVGSEYLRDETGAKLTNSSTKGIVQNSTTTALGTYDFGATVSATGLYLTYELQALYLLAGQTTVLDNDTAFISGGAELHAIVSGSGNLQINATDAITLNHANTYTGTTTVSTGTLITGVNNALGSTSLLSLESQSSLNLNHTTQTVGVLNNNGTLLFSGGTLTVTNGGTSTGTLSGSGLLNVSGNNLTVTVSNPTLTATGSVASSATLTLNTADAFGSGTLMDSGLVVFNGATGTNQNTFTGAGSVLVRDQSVLVLGGANTSFSGTWTVEAASNLKAITEDSLGTGAVNVSGTLTLGGVSSFILNTSNLISGGGVLVKEDANTVTISHSNSYTGGSVITGGTLNLANLQGTGTGNVLNNASLELSGSGTYMNAISGTGLNTVSGNGVTITGSNTAFTGTWDVTGSGTMLAVENLGASGTAAFNIDGDLSLTFGGTSFEFNHALTGSGYLLVQNTGTFDFGSTTGSAFTGTVELQNNIFALTASNAAPLTNATLTVGANNVTIVDSDTTAPSRNVGGLTFSGGTIRFEGYDPHATIADTIITVTDRQLDVSGGGTVEVVVPDPSQIPDGSKFTHIPLLQQDEGVALTQLISATNGVIGSAAALELRDDHGNLVSGSYTLNLSHDGVTTDAIGTYDYLLSSGAANDGLYVAFGLKQADIQAGRTLTLDQDTTTPAQGDDFSATIIGGGNLQISASTSITLNGTGNSYSGTTIVNTGTLIAGINEQMFASSTAFVINSGAALDTGGFDQQVNNLTGGGLATFTGNTLTVNNTNDTSFTGTLSGSALVKEGGGQLNANTATANLTQVQVENGEIVLGQNATVSGGNNPAVITNGGTATFNSSTLTTTGSDLIVAKDNSPATVNLNNMTVSVASGGHLAEVNNGSLTLNLNNTVATGDISALNGATGLVNLTNSSTLTGKIDPVDVSLDTSSVWNMTGNSQVVNLQNNGVVDFVTDGSYNKTLTVTNLNGSGAFGMNVSVAQNASDYLRVTGNASGTHQVNIKRTADDMLAIVPSLELPMIGIGTDLGVSFSGQTDIGMRTAILQLGDLSGNNRDQWFLALSGSVIPPTVPPTKHAVLASAAIRELGEDTLVKRMGELRLGVSGSGWLDNVWVRGYGSQYNAGAGVTGHNFTSTNYGTDMGVDKQWQLDTRNALFTGLFGGYGRTDLDLKLNGGSGKNTSYRGGLYASWLHDTGWYADLVGKAERYESEFTSYDASCNKTTGDYGNWSVGASLELGRQFQFADGWYAEPQLQASYVHQFGTDYMTGGDNPFAVHLGDKDIAQLRFGSMFGRTISVGERSKLQPYLKIFGVEQMSNGGKVRTADGEWRPGFDGPSAIIGAGVIWQLNERHQLHLDYEAQFGKNYDKPWGVNAGYRYQF